MQLQGFIANPTPENSRAIPGAVFNFLTRGEQTGGKFALIQIDVQHGNEPPSHTHSLEDEAYFIFEGRVRYRIGAKEVVAGPGDFVYLPQGLPHQFEILTTNARMIMWVSPAGLDQWFWDNSVPAPDMQPLPLPQGPPPPEAIDHFVRTLGMYGVEMDPMPAESSH